MAGIHSPTSRGCADLAGIGRQGLLTAKERDVVNAALNSNVPASFRPIVNLHQLPLPLDPSMALRTASGYPSGFIASVFSEGGCKVTSARNSGWGGAAGLLTLRPDGRVARVSVVDTGVPGSCADSVRTLLMTYADPLELNVAEGGQALVMIPFLPDYVTCQSDSTPPGAGTSGRASTGPSGSLKKVRDVRPEYPDSARRDHAEGVVMVQVSLAAAGCVRAARVTRSVDPRLDWAAMIAVLQWRFSPVFLGGFSAAPRIDATIQFTLSD
jgi:TonB family protein